MNSHLDVLVIGAGMAGASVAAHLAVDRSVALLEIEDRPGRHATGRSAAMYFESYGNSVIRGLTAASRGFFENPPEGFCEAPLLTTRGCIFVADEARSGRVDDFLEKSGDVPSIRRISPRDALARVPILRPDWLAACLSDDSGRDIDVHALHSGYLRSARRSGATLVLNAGSTRFDRRDGLWTVETLAGTYSAAVLVNAAGAWGDQVANLCGATPVGLEPMRRTVITVPTPPDIDIQDWPLVIDIDEEFYFKPDAGHLLISPANEDASAPCDAVPDEMDIAIVVDRFERATTLPVERINHRWAGLRTFAADRSPVVGFDDEVAGFFWLVGQGGYGIQTAPAMGALAASMIRGEPLPAEYESHGVTEEMLSPSRVALRRGNRR